MPSVSILTMGMLNRLATANGRFLRHRFSPKPKVIATQNSLPKRNHVAKEAVSAALPTNARQRSERICKPNDAPRAKPRPCVKTMLADTALRLILNLLARDREIRTGVFLCQSMEHFRVASPSCRVRHDMLRTRAPSALYQPGWCEGE